MSHPICELCQEWLLVRFTSTKDEVDRYVKAVRDVSSAFEEHMGVPCALHPTTTHIDSADAVLIRLLGLQECLLHLRMVPGEVTLTNSAYVGGRADRTLTINDTAGREYQYLRRR